MKIDRRLLYSVLLLTLLLLLPGTVSLADKPDAPYGLGLVPSPPGDYPRAQLRVDAPLPAAVDLSEGMPPVRNQGSQSSCVGWAVGYYYRSYQEGLERGYTPQANAELFSPSFIYNQRRTSDCSRDAGMSMVDGLRIAVDLGVATLETMPYTTGDTCAAPSDEALAEAGLYRAESYLNLFSGKGRADLALLKQHLAAGDPVLLAVPIYSEFYRANARDALIDLPEPESTFYGGHAVTLVGYDDAAEAFRFVNSWGSYWGEGGYGYLSYDFVQQECWEGWVLVDADTTPPDLADHADELGGTESGMIQGEINSPVFAWTPSNDPTATYEVYWGPDADGTGGERVTEPLYVSGVISQPEAQRYLRVRAVDGAGNASDWRTLFVFCFRRPAASTDIMALQPVEVRGRAEIIGGARGTRD